MGCGLCPYNAIEKVGNYGYNLAKLQQNTADILNNVYEVLRQNYGELKNAGNDTSINVFSILS